MSKDETDRLERMERTLDRLATAVLGDKEAGHLGLVERVNNYAGRIKSLERWRMYYAAIGTGIIGVVGVLYKLATDWWPRK